ncbi:unnamed protein product [Enterobius vermicularis]|uniref:Uncharacterized protein n=1 Tax=Enterobius vermicularis TaxID=51028 RepID=A0A0N4UTZ0_ENTVE|nr:unnamed protein product [Enterobius vermicularis]
MKISRMENVKEEEEEKKKEKKKQWKKWFDQKNLMD